MAPLQSTKTALSALLRIVAFIALLGAQIVWFLVEALTVRFLLLLRHPRRARVARPSLA